MGRKKEIVYVDMDFTLCDYEEGFNRHKKQHPTLAYPQREPGLYISLMPISGALETYTWLHDHPETDVFILTSPSFKNPHSYSEKRQWVEKHLGMKIVERLIISPRKDLNLGDYLIDDCDSGKGQDRFQGELIHFGSEKYPDWAAVKDFFELNLSK